ncbi:MAG: cyclic nucleotide-binding domain-containing protein [Rhodomicrobium sp.]|nr:cyclic nucleotide-binding domain-containing protein [Rhodomicrobium sp.]
MDDEARAKVYQFSRWKSFPAHHVIFRDGDQADHYFNITSGIVKLVKTLADGHQHIVGLIYPPGFLGQSLNPRHNYSAESATHVELCSYPKAPFDAVLNFHPELRRPSTPSSTSILSSSAKSLR